MKKTKIMVGRDVIGRFTCDGEVPIKKKGIKAKWNNLVFKIRKAIRNFINETFRITKSVIVIMAFVTIGGWLAYGALTAEKLATPSIASAQVIDHSGSVLTSKIDALKVQVVNEIKSCEGSGHKESDGLIILDTNNKASIGLLQFQIATIIHYEKTLYGKSVTPKEAVEIALDDAKSTALARDVMFKTQNMAGKDWVNCSAKFGSDQKIQMIKQLEK